MSNKKKVILIIKCSIAFFFCMSISIASISKGTESFWGQLMGGITGIDYVSQISKNDAPVENSRTAQQVYNDILNILDHGRSVRTYNLFYSHISNFNKISCYNGGDNSYYKPGSKWPKDKLCAMVSAFQKYYYKTGNKGIIDIGISNHNLKSFQSDKQVKSYLQKINDNFRYARIRTLFVGNEPLLSIGKKQLGGLTSIYEYLMIVKNFVKTLNANKDLNNLNKTTLATSISIAEANSDKSQGSLNYTYNFLLQCDNPNAESININYGCYKVVLNKRVVFISKNINKYGTLAHIYYDNVLNLAKTLNYMKEYNNSIGKKNIIFVDEYAQYLGLCDLSSDLKSCHIPNDKGHTLPLKQIMGKIISNITHYDFTTLDMYFGTSLQGSTVGIAEIGTAYTCADDNGLCDKHHNWFTPHAFLNFYNSINNWKNSRINYPKLIFGYQYEDALYKKIPGDSTQDHMGMYSFYKKYPDLVH